MNSNNSTIQQRSARWLEEFEQHRRVLIPDRPDWIEYSTKEHNLLDDPTGENYESFFDRLRDYLPNKPLRRIRQAYIFSKYGHRGAYRKNGERYFNHPRRSALIVLDELQILDQPKLVQAILLHDLREDSLLLDASLIKRIFGAEVMRIVNLLTKDQRRKHLYFKILINSGNWRALLIKCCDRLDNMRTVHDMSLEKIPEQIKETRDEFPAVIEALRVYAPEKLKWVADVMATKIFDVCDVQETLWKIAEADSRKRRRRQRSAP